MIPIHVFFDFEEKQEKDERLIKLQEITEVDDDSEILNMIEDSEAIRPITKKMSFFEILKIFPVFTTSMCMATSLMCLTFKEPILQIRLAQDNLKVWIVGLIFSLDTITYSVTSFFLNFIPEEKKNFPKLV